MASQFHIFLFFLVTLLLYTQISFATSSQDYDDDDDFVTQLNHNPLEKKQEKLSYFKVYWHDITSGTKPTSMEIVPPLLNYTSSSAFGSVNMIDNPLTMGPELSSKIIGRAQGFYASTSQSEVDLLMVMNFAIMEGQYNGSTITILGRNPVFNKEREMPVIGGSGLFRFARGYAQIRTHWFSPTTKAAIVEYNIYVLHYIDASYGWIICPKIMFNFILCIISYFLSFES